MREYFVEHITHFAHNRRAYLTQPHSVAPPRAVNYELAGNAVDNFLGFYYNSGAVKMRLR